MKHATMRALNRIFQWYNPWEADGDGLRYACNWDSTPWWKNPNQELFNGGEAAELLAGKQVVLPTCPACAALLDLALEMSGR